MDSIRRTVFAGLFVVAASGLLLAGCSDSVLDVEPTNNIAESNVWDSEGLTNSYLNDIYARLEVIPSWYLSSGAVRNLEDAFGGAVRAGPTDEWTPMYWMPQLQITEEGVPGVPGWQEYNPIQYWNWDELRETNIVIENLEKENKGSIAPSVREKAVAEARWMRAYIYFEKVIRYGGVPIIRSPQEPFADSSEVFVKRNTEKEVYDFILEELNTVINSGALSASRHDGGRATVWAAHALKSRAMLHAASVAEFGGGNADLAGQSDLLGIPSSEADTYWQAAYDAATEVIDNGPHRLFNQSGNPAENFQQLFLTGCNENPESIFCVRFDGQTQGHGYTRTTTPHAVEPSIWSGNAAITWSLVERFGFEEGQFADQIGGQIDRDALLNQQWTQEELFGNRDARFRGVMGYPGGTFRDTDLHFHAATRVDGERQESTDYPVPLEGVDTDWPKSGHTGDWRATGLIGLKYTSPDPSKIGKTDDDTDWMEFRLGEMYLNAAEAAYHLDMEGEARDLINTLRDRAGMPSVSYSGTNLRNLIRNERRVELALEHQLYWDLRRWRVAHEELDGTRFKGVNFIYDWDNEAYEIQEFKNAWGQPFTFPKRQYYHPLGTQRVADTGLEENPGY